MVYWMSGDKVPELSLFGTTDWGPEGDAFAKAVSDQLFLLPVKDCVRGVAAGFLSSNERYCQHEPPPGGTICQVRHRALCGVILTPHRSAGGWKVDR